MGVVQEVDGSFKKAGAIPFKWETRPGVPKSELPNPQPPRYKYEQDDDDDNHGDDHTSPTSLRTTPYRLTPPPRTQSLRSISKMRSDLQWYDPEPEPPLPATPESASPRSILSSRFRWKWGLKRLASKVYKPKLETEPKPESEPKPAHGLKLGSLTRLSMSTRPKSLSPLHGSRSSSFSSYRSSP